MTSFSRWFALAGAALLVGIAYAALFPADWQVRTGLHWLVEHFLIFFTVTALFCLAWPKPMAVAAVLLPFSVLIEIAQFLTPDRQPNLESAMSGVAGVALAALLAKLFIAWRSSAEKAGRP